MNPVAIDTDQFLAATTPPVLSETDILDCFNAVPVGDGRGGYLVAVGRAIEAQVRAKLPRAELLRAAAYLASSNDEDSTIDVGEANRIAAVLRGLAA